ncbi:hypothetical protein D3C87_1938850 [compost metagenome]
MPARSPHEAPVIGIEDVPQPFEITKLGELPTIVMKPGLSLHQTHRVMAIVTGAQPI